MRLYDKVCAHCCVHRCEWHNHESLSHQGMYRAVSADENEKNIQRRYFDKYNKMSLLPNVRLLL